MYKLEGIPKIIHWVLLSLVAVLIVVEIVQVSQGRPLTVYLEAIVLILITVDWVIYRYYRGR